MTEMTDNDDDIERIERCMTQVEINRKHVRIRGSMAYKYPPKESRCRTKCGLGDMPVLDRFQNRKHEDHRCFLGIAHDGDCEFSSECGLSVRKAS